MDVVEGIVAVVAGVLASSVALVGFGVDSFVETASGAVTAIALVVMPLLGRAKLRPAAALGSGALRADAYETITCAWLSLTTLAGLVLAVPLVVIVFRLSQAVRADGLPPHGTITITRDADFMGCACVTSGSGIPSDLFVIGPWLITAPSTSGLGAQG